jgi:hypothetical protein
MSMKFSSILIRKDYSSDWNKLIRDMRMEESLTGQQVTWTESISATFQDKAVGALNGCTLINSPWLAVNASWTPEQENEQDTKCMAMSKDADTVMVYVDEVTDSCGFEWFHGGKRVRIYHYWMGELKTDSGPMLPAEKGEDPMARAYDVMAFMLGKSFDELVTANPEMQVLA